MTPILSYCMNVHPGESVDEIVDLLRGPVARVRQAWRPDVPMGAGLWLPREAARTIASDEGAATRVREALEEAGLFAYTANAFPIGGFHGERVKQDVYRPTWMEPERLVYTLLACQALAKLLPEGSRGSVSTVPVGYKSFPDAGMTGRAGAHLGRLALELERLAQDGRELTVALEPEPLALLETTSEAISFLQAEVFSGAGRGALIEAGYTPSQAEEVIRRRIGVCVDTCHLACEFEHIPDSLSELASAGVQVFKAQLSSALELTDPATNHEGRGRLRGFDEPRYLHQSVGLDGRALPARTLLRAEDLGDLLELNGNLTPAFVHAAVTRTHFHVPVCWEGDQVLGTTRPVLEDALASLAAATDHLEVETYTFDVMPAEERARFDDDVVNMLAAELRWVDSALGELGIQTR